MDRLAYSPLVKCWVKSDSGVVDLSPYITKCSVTRSVDDVSKAEVEFRNPKAIGPSGKPRFLFTERETSSGLAPVFHPMDPITIVMQRLADKPIQVFTGYCDTVPYVQLFPGTARIKASCTLKRLLHTYWDPGLEFVRDFMKEYGWDLNVKTGQAQNQEQAVKAENPVDAPINSVKLNDGSIGHLLYGVLNEIGGWNNDNIYIQSLPPAIAPMVSNLFDQINKDNKQVNQEISDFIRRVIGEGAYGVISNQPDAATPSGGGGNSPVLPADAPALVKKWKDEADRIARHLSRYVSAGQNSGIPNATSVPGGANSERAPGHLTRIPVDADGAYLFDCSSFVAYMLKFIDAPGTSSWTSAGSSADFVSYGEPGEGRYITIWAKEPAGPTGHVFFEFKQSNSSSRFIGTNPSQKETTPGSKKNANGGVAHTVSWHNHTTSGFTARHPAGL